MRLWSIHPQYLDAKGIVALWREALLAQKVLQNRTKGYKHHPQLQRFRSSKNPLGAIGNYLWEVHLEAVRRGYEFNKKKINRRGVRLSLSVTRGQMAYEVEHLMRKLKVRDKSAYVKLKACKKILTHPLFKVRVGPIESWERHS